MWFADLICNINWFTACAGNVGASRIRTEIPCPDPNVKTWLSLYGTDDEVFHARVLMDVSSRAEADRVSDLSIQYWLSLISVTGSLGAGKALKPDVFPGSSSIAVVLGEGDEQARSVAISQFGAPDPINYTALEPCLATWSPSAQAHLFYLSRFLDTSLPLDTRWLNGYRLAEWHFQRNRVGLAGNVVWREFLEQFRPLLAPHLRSDQTLHGFMEEARALVAHALLDGRAVDDRLVKPGGPVLWSFPAMERMVIAIANLAELNLGLVALRPKA